MTTINHHEYLVQRARAIVPAYRFDDRWRDNLSAWCEGLRGWLDDALKPWPARCEPEARWEKIEQRDGYSVHRVTYLTEPGLAAVAYAGIPDGAACGSVLCIHGHGPLGAQPVLAVGNDPAVAQQVEHYHYDYGCRLAQRGFVVFAPCLRGFGQRLNDREHAVQRDTCDANFFQQMLLGEVAITSQLHDLRVALDVMSALKTSGGTGCAGLSYGGRLTMFLAAIEPRIEAAVVSGALNSFVERIASYASCAYQVVPGLLRQGDVGELLGLIAPKPLAIELGDEDGCCPVDAAMGEWARVKAVYETAGASENLNLFRFRGGHIFHGGESLDWLASQLTKA